MKPLSISFWPILALATCILLISGFVHAQSNTIEIQIDPDKKNQVWEGFGASGAWWPTWVMNFSADKRKELLSRLYGADGLGMQIYRYNIPAGSGNDVTEQERRTPNIENPDGTVDVNLDKNGMMMLHEVKNAGATQFVLFSNSPPARLTLSGTPSGGEQGASNLKPGAEPEFAKYLMDVAQQIQKELKLPTLTISPINEPQWNWGKDRRNQEGCHYSPKQAAVLIHAVIVERDKRKLTYPIEAPESGQWNGSSDYATELFSDALIRKNITHFAVHSYWSVLKQKKEFSDWMHKHDPEIKLSMSEYCIMKHGHDLSIDSGLELAQVMYEDIAVAHVVTWQWWLALARGGYTDSLIYANPKTLVIDIPKRYDAMAHFSKFIKPGDVNIDVSTTTDIFTTAFLSRNRRQIICVLGNLRLETVNIHFNTGKFKPQSVKGFITDSMHSLAPEQLTTTTEAQLLPRSLTTIIFNLDK